MRFEEYFQQNPLGVILGCAIWIPICIWTITMIVWTIRAEMEAWYGLPLAILPLGLGLIANSPNQPVWVGPAAFFMVIGLMAAFPIVKGISDTRTDYAFQMESAEEACQTLRQTPNNLGAKMRLGRVLVSRGFPAHAVALCEEALRGQDESAVRIEIRQVREWRGEVKGEYEIPEVKCASCGFNNLANVPLCGRCKEPYMLYVVRGDGQPQPVKTAAGWVLVALIVLSIALTLAVNLNTALKMTIIGILAVAGILIAVRLAKAAAEAKV